MLIFFYAVPEFVTSVTLLVYASKWLFKKEYGKFRSGRSGGKNKFVGRRERHGDLTRGR